MSRYIVRVHVASFYDIEVTARNEDEAIALAKETTCYPVDEIMGNAYVLEGESQVINASDTIRVQVDWDVDDVEDLESLPSVVEVPDGVEENDICDWISDNYGFCINSWTYC